MNSNLDRINLKQYLINFVNSIKTLTINWGNANLGFAEMYSNGLYQNSYFYIIILLFQYVN